MLRTNTWKELWHDATPFNSSIATDGQFTKKKNICKNIKNRKEIMSSPDLVVLWLIFNDSCNVLKFLMEILSQRLQEDSPEMPV